MNGITVRFAERGDFPDLINIWRVCFGDGEKELEFIFGRFQRPENMLVLDAGNGPVATLSTHPFTLSSDGEECAAMYVYGVATLPEHRGKGYAAELLRYAGELCAERGVACSALVPAGPGLFEFYSKHGYETMFMLNKASAGIRAVPGGKAFSLRPVSAGELMAARERYLGSGIFAKWNEEYLNFIVSASSFFEGGAFGFEYEGELCCTVFQKDGDRVLIKELAAPESAVDGLLRALEEKCGAKRFVIYLREDVQTSYTNNLLPFGMVKWYDNKTESMMREGGKGPAYITHAMD